MDRIDIGRKIKCIHIQTHDERLDEQGAMIVGEDDED